MSTALSATQHLSGPSQHEQSPDWKRQLAERLDAYRAKHSDISSQSSSALETTADSRASRIARVVALRYASAPTYSELLAAAQAKQAAEAALAEQAALDFRAAQESIVEDQVIGPAIPESTAGALDRNDASSLLNEQASSTVSQPATPVMPQFATRTQEMHLHQSVPEPEPTLEDLWASVLVEPRSLLPSKLIEFPRELVSSHRARPRAAQDATAESSAAASQPEPTQLRIFEVQPDSTDLQGPAETVKENAPATLKTDSQLPNETIVRSSSAIASPNSIPGSGPAPGHVPVQAPVPAGTNRTGSATVERSAVPSQKISSASTSSARAYKNLEWAAISLDKEPTAAPHKVETSIADYVPFLVDPASIDRRVMAFAVDFAAVTAGFLAFLLVFAASTPHLPTGLPGIALAGVVYVSLWVLYQMLFFSLSGSTAGMLYAHIALCTFDDQNPTRPALRRRLAAWWLSCLPLGLGFLWCFVDEDNLGWHDRITQMYQREY